MSSGRACQPTVTMSGKPSASTSTAFHDSRRCGCRVRGWRRECALPRIEQQTHIGHVVIGHGKIDRAITVQIQGADGGWAGSTRDRSRRSEFAVPAAEQHAHAVTELVGDRQVHRTVPVQSYAASEWTSRARISCPAPGFWSEISRSAHDSRRLYLYAPQFGERAPHSSEPHLGWPMSTLPGANQPFVRGVGPRPGRRQRRLGVLDRAAPVVAELRADGFWLADTFVEEFLRGLGERA